MPDRLPPLSALRLFEAAGRHLSFKLAAEELFLTPSAVSHGIRGLEDWLGVALFHRAPQGLSLTPAGTAYLPEVRAGLDRLAAASAAVSGRGPAAGRRLAISVAPSFGLRWLIPRLGGFHERHPGIEVAVDTRRHPTALPREGVDLAIRMGQGDWPGLRAERLVGEALVPVAAPAVAKTIATPADLHRQTRLHVSSVTEDWAAWARLSGIALAERPGDLRFDTIDMALTAAIQGMGVAIGRLPLVAADLAAGRLVAVLGPARHGATGYWLVAPPGKGERPEAAVFAAWLRGELAEAVVEATVDQRPV